MVFVKPAQHFARNTVNALETIRLLRRWKVDIYFEQEDIHSLHVIAGNHKAIVKG